MVWKYGDFYLKAGKSWTETNGTKHPAQWMRWTDAEKKAKGLTWEDDVDTSYDDRFYWAKGIERKLADVNVVDDDGKAVIDPMTDKQMVQLGLKSIWVIRTKTTAQDKLNKHDWMIVRNAEKSTAIPSDITTYRDAIRTKCASIETSINNCSSLADFIKLFDVPMDSNDNPTGNAPIYDFPDEV